MADTGSGLPRSSSFNKLFNEEFLEVEINVRENPPVHSAEPRHFTP
jgi:hypothetical protein